MPWAVEAMTVDALRIVVADDDSNVRTALVALLEATRDVTVVGAACDAGEAVDLVASRRPDVVILDVVMPGDGVRAAQRIREVSPVTRVVALSAHDTQTYRRQMREAGAIAYLVKGDVGVELGQVLSDLRTG